MSSVFILTNNPAKSRFPKYPKWIQQTANGKRIEADWSTGIRNSGIESGDIGFLLRQKDHRGLIAMCEFTGVVYQRGHWDPDHTGKANYADLDWIRILEPANRLPIEELNTRVRGVNWDRMQGSGVLVDPAPAKRLRTLWDEHLLLLGGPPYVNDGSKDEVEVFDKDGRRKRVSHVVYERKAKLRKQCIDKHGYLCAGCGFDFEKFYGERGANFIHVHHKNPLAQADGPVALNPVKDMVPLCPNCHAMVHRHNPILTIAKLRNLLGERARGS